MKMSFLAVTTSIATGVIITTVFAQSPPGTCYPSCRRIFMNGYVGSPLTPNALNGGHAGFPEFHNVYIEPCSYAKYKETYVFPEGTIFFKELQLTLPPQDFPDGSRNEPSGRGYFPGPWNGADVTVKNSKRYPDGGWGYYNFNHHEPKAPTAKLKPVTECAFCHVAGAKKDEVWTQFYPLLDTGIGMPTPGMPTIK